MVRFQEFINNLLLTLHGHYLPFQQRELYTFLTRYQQFASHAYCGAAGTVSKMASRRGKAFGVLRYEVSRSVITVQREFTKYIIFVWCAFINRAKLTAWTAQKTVPMLLCNCCLVHCAQTPLLYCLLAACLVTVDV
jgi:hypothetical protein